jgi:enterochelin esterase-like enzyme
MTAVLEWSLLSGPLPWVLVGAGAVGGALLLGARTPTWWQRTVPAVLAAVAAAVAALVVLTTVVWSPVPDALPAVVWLCIGVALAAVALAVARILSPVRGRLAAAFGAALVLLAAVEGANLYYGEVPTVRTALGLPYPDEVEFADTPVHAARLVAPAAGTPLERKWTPPRDMPAVGRVAEVRIPATASGFPARPAWIYLPPAYLGSTRARLPVLVLLAGQPGSPSDWLDGGDLAGRMDAYAARHRGLAPIVVMPDTLGDPLANPLCLDSRLGEVATYLRVDVPAWIGQHLEAGPGRAIGGLSAGGTCALQTALNAPDVYPTFVDISGQAEPTLGSRAETVAAAFGGDEAAFRAVNPLDLLRARQFRDTQAYLVAGSEDADYRPQAEKVYAALRAAGVPATLTVLPGGHTWQVWGPGLDAALPWLAGRLGLTG